MPLPRLEVVLLNLDAIPMPLLKFVAWLRLLHKIIDQSTNMLSKLVPYTVSVL